MKLFLFYTLLIYILSLILSCSDLKDKTNEKEAAVIIEQKDSVIYTLDDTLIAHASVLNNKAYGILKSKLLKSIRDIGIKKSINQCTYKENIDFLNFCKNYNVKIERHNINNNILEDSILNSLKRKKVKTKVIHSESSSKVYIGLKIDQSICLSCHGIPYQDILSETWDALIKKDTLFNQHSYKSNDLIGVWETTFYKKKKD